MPASPPQTPLRPASVIVTVRNDRAGLDELLAALAAQTSACDDVVVVDAGSTDGTGQTATAWAARGLPVRLVVAPGVNISAGRNVAVDAAVHDWIVSTDAGCRPVPGWLSAMTAVPRDVDFAGGIYIVEPSTPFERALAVSLYPSPLETADVSPLIRLSHRLFGRRNEASASTGRSMAFSRSAWRAVGGFPEHLYAGEDVAFSSAVVSAGFDAVLVPEAAVRWRPRRGWRSNARMYATYARGGVRGCGGRRHLARLAAYAGGGLLATTGGPLARVALAAGFAAYVGLPFERARRASLLGECWWRIPAVVVMKDLAQLYGAALGARDALLDLTQPIPSERTARRRPRDRRPGLGARQ